MNNKEKKTHSMKARGMISDVIVHVVLALLAIVWVIPVLWIALLSFSTQKGSYVTSFFPKGYTFKNFTRLFTDTQILDFPQMFMNTFIIACFCCYLHCFPALTPNPLPSPPPLRLLKRTLEKASQFPIRGRIFFTSEHTVSRRKDASRWRRRAWDAHHFAKEEGSSHPQTRRALQALVCLQRSCFAASSAFREVPKKEGVVSLKRGNSFFVQKKHSDYENPNACGRM